jgi:hypothetical protein
MSARSEVEDSSSPLRNITRPPAPLLGLVTAVVCLCHTLAEPCMIGPWVRLCPGGNCGANAKHWTVLHTTSRLPPNMLAVTSAQPALSNLTLCCTQHTYSVFHNRATELVQHTFNLHNSWSVTMLLLALLAALQHYPDLVPVPYDSLISGTERSDLWRVLVLHKVRCHSNRQVMHVGAAFAGAVGTSKKYWSSATARTCTLLGFLPGNRACCPHACGKGGSSGFMGVSSDYLGC